MVRRFWEKVDKSGDCWNWTGATTQGYGAFWLDGKTVNAHRVAWELTHSHPGDSYVLHRCDNRRCCNPDHLFLGTHQDNVADMVAKGRHKPGVVSKLTPAQVVEIKHLLPTTSSKELARAYNVSPAAISHIKTGETWSHI
jgi:hypothetical protein